MSPIMDLFVKLVISRSKFVILFNSDFVFWSTSESNIMLYLIFEIAELMKTKKKVSNIFLLKIPTEFKIKRLKFYFDKTVADR